MHRRHRVLVAILALAAFLFSQGAVAVHACGTMVAAAVMQSPCEQGHGEGEPNLCVSHCDFGNASVDSGNAVLSQPQLIESGLRLPTLQAMAAPRHAWLQRAAAADPEPPPTRYTVLRI